tara:strand:- start:259 stop:1017 length:759 start_codon:yes stop_codon:yes gene_type:complete
MQFNVLTIFPDIIHSYTRETILGRAQKNKHITVDAVNLRDFAEDQRRTVDDTPYGGGAGMVMKPEPIYKALQSVDAIPFTKVTGLKKVSKVFSGDIRKKKRTILLSPRGRTFDQRVAQEWSALDSLTMVCGRYEGVDQRVVDHMIDEEVSIGNYVLAGGELGALVIIEAVARLISGVLGNPESLSEETFSLKKYGTKKTENISVIEAEYPQYTKPESFRGWQVPAVLRGGNHKEIERWREENSVKKNLTKQT